RLPGLLHGRIVTDARGAGCCEPARACHFCKFVSLFQKPALAPSPRIARMLSDKDDLPMTHPSRTGGQILVDALQIHGVDIAFGVPGESYLDVLDALHDSHIRFVINRQEGGAAFMAEAY